MNSVNLWLVKIQFTCGRYLCRRSTVLKQLVFGKHVTSLGGNRSFCLRVVSPTVCSPTSWVDSPTPNISVRLRFICKSFKTELFKSPCWTSQKNWVLRWNKPTFMVFVTRAAYTKEGWTFDCYIIQKDVALTKLAWSHFSARFNFYIDVAISCIMNFIS